MIKTSTPIITTALLLGGSFLILSVPSWMAYLVLTAMVGAQLVHWGIKYRDKFSVTWRFITEFCGFCFLVLLFVTTVVIMNQILAT